MATLIVLGAPSPGVRLHLKRGGSATLGRDSGCDLVIEKRTLSRVHAVVSFQQDQFLVEDNGSTNGTFVNGRKITARTPLNDGDRIDLHDVPLVFFLSDQFENDESTIRVPATNESPLGKTDIEIPKFIGLSGSGSFKNRLHSLVEITRHLGSTLDTEKLLPRLLELLFRMFSQTVLGEIHLVNRSGTLVPVAMKHGREGDSTDLTDAPINSRLIEEVFRSGEGTLHSDTLGDSESILDNVGDSSLCVPIVGPGYTPLGVILLQTDDSSRFFTNEDLEITSLVGVVAGQALGYSRAHEVVVKHERMERHLNAARTIQLSMLPRETPQLADYSFCNHYMAAERVGGDYFFYEPLGNGQIVFGIADASGKGLQASMQIVRFAGEVRLRIATCRTLKTVLEKLNQFVCSFDDSKFITSCICVLDPVKHQLTLANAGHLYPLWFHAQSGTVDKVVTANGGLPLGLDPKEKFHPVRISMKPGDRVVLYTDGISEAMNVDLEQYSTERLVEVIAESREPLPGLIQQIEQDVVRFRNGQDASDDVCVMGLERAR